MKARLSLIFTALVVLLGAMIFVVEDRTPAASIPAMAIAASAAAPVASPAPVSSVAPPISAPTASPVAVARTTDPLTAALAPLPVASTVPPQPPTETTPVKSAPMVHVARSGEMKYVARAGDTVSELAVALLGTDSKENRAAVIDANASLQANPDRVLAGSTYSIAPPSAEQPIAPQATTATEASATAAASSAPRTAADSLNETAGLQPLPTAPAARVAIDTTPTAPLPIPAGPRLKYTAKLGDTVGILAANLLGGDTRTNREILIAANKSLQADPDHLVAGQTYTIVAPDGLAADPNAPSTASPTTRPTADRDADEAAKQSVGRSLRYTAKPGDSVSRLAVALLGEDTPANRELIIKSNPTLREDPDHLIAGQTYWIGAPNP